MLAYSARSIVRAHTGKLHECAALRVAVAFELLVVWPAALYFYLLHPYWSWMYLVDPRRVPHVVALLCLLADAGALIGGFIAGYALVRAGKYRELAGAIGLAFAGCATLCVLLRRRLFTYATYDEWRTGSALASIVEVKLGLALVVIGGACAAALVYAGWQLHLAGRRLS